MKSCDNCISTMCDICRHNRSPDAEARNLIGDYWKLNPMYYMYDMDKNGSTNELLTDEEINQMIQSGYDYERPVHKKPSKKIRKMMKKIEGELYESGSIDR